MARGADGGAPGGSAPAFRPAILVLIVAAATLTVAAAGMLFSTFMLYDDEGYVLLTLKNFIAHGRLYRDVFSQYGPFPYALYAALHAVGFPLTHMAERSLTLAAWAGAAVCATTLAWRASRDVAFSLAVLAGTYVYLWIMVSEPAHPGGLIAIMTALLAACGAAQLAADRVNAWAATAGILVTALGLTKVNVGAFAALSFGAVWLLHHRDERIRRAAPWLLAAIFTLLPFALMRTLLGMPWVRSYATLFALSGVTAAVVTARQGSAQFDRRTLARTALGGLLVIAVVVGCVLVRGSSLRDLLEGMLLGPLRLPANFSLSYPWPAGVVVLAVASTALCFVARARPERAHVPIALLRLAAAIGVAVNVVRFPHVSPDTGVFGFVMPLLWLFLWPLPSETRGPARIWPAFVLLGQCLHPFPVPGSQIAWGTFLAVPVAAVGAWSAAGFLASRWPRLCAWKWAAQVGLAGVALAAGVHLAQIGRRALDSRALGLPGAEQLRLPDSTTATYRLLALNATAHSDMLFSLPGMFSFNLWTDLPTPTLANVTHWFSLLNAAQQEAILAALKAHPRAAVIVQPDHLDFLRQRGFIPHGALYDYVMSEFTPAFAVDGFEFRVHRGRRIAALHTAEVLARPAADAGSLPDTLLRIEALLPPGRTVARIEIAPMDGWPAPTRVFLGGTSRVDVTPINLQGEAIGPEKVQTLPVTLAGPVRLALYFDRGDTPLSLVHTQVILRDPAGEEIALVRLRP